ncbi:B3 domain-containing protein At2g31720-like [Dillenia turbinata]|uniref:B3 domain-containing protein At2g31720-like n=1 Tax=Dillenia turbinata TaxID=194707 RepID=A0AAN8ZA30_9MAGN
MERTQKDFMFLGKKTEDFEDPIHMLCFLLEHELEQMNPNKTPKIFCSKRLRNQEGDQNIDYEAEARTMKKQRKKVNRVIDNGPNPAPDLPVEFKNAIAEEFRGTHIVLVIQKRIFASDVRPGQNRFSVPVRQVRTEFLTEEEKRKLNNEDLSVVLIQPCLESIKMNMKTWVMAKENGKASSSYMLKTEWGKVVKKNNIKEGEIVQLWAFRTEMTMNGLGFALVRIRRAGKGKQEEEEEQCITGGNVNMAASSSSQSQVLSH